MAAQYTLPIESIRMPITVRRLVLWWGRRVLVVGGVGLSLGEVVVMRRQRVWIIMSLIRAVNIWMMNSVIIAGRRI
jgi:hypothetical protein